MFRLNLCCSDSLRGRALLLLEHVVEPAHPGPPAGDVAESRREQRRPRVGRLAHSDAAEAEAPAHAYLSRGVGLAAAKRGVGLAAAKREPGSWAPSLTIQYGLLDGGIATPGSGPEPKTLV